MLTYRVKLKKAVGRHPAGATIHATRGQLAEAELKPGIDYEVLGTPPVRPSVTDLAAIAPEDPDHAATPTQDGGH